MRLSDRALAASVWGLGITQVVGFGTLYYSFSILAPAMAHDFASSQQWIFGALSAALLVGGLVAPVSGRWVDRYGAGHMMALGSVASAASLAACALAPERYSFALALVGLQMAAGFVLYNTAFALLVQIAPRRAPRMITYLTLIGGFASTLFWPATTLLHKQLTWQGVWLVFAAANLLICAPIHWRLSHLMRRATATKATIFTEVEESDMPVPAEIPEPVVGSLAPHQRREAFAYMAAGFTLMSFVLSALLVHMVPMLSAVGLGATAVLVGTVFGPAQVLARFLNMIFGRNLSASSLAVISALALPAAIAVLMATAPWFPGAIVFALLFGAGSGLNSIAQGTLPLALFGSEGYATLLGRVTAIRFIVSATAPFIYAFLAEQFGVQTALGFTLAVGALSVFAFLGIMRLTAAKT